MNTITAKVATESGGKYVRQLCKHWSHKLETEVDGDKGKVTFSVAVAEMVADSEGIAIAVSGAERAEVERVADAVARHLDRFAFREAPLTYEWHWQENAA